MSWTRPQPVAAKPGFTVIEVMIVLAIAGLILSIMLLAIPTLQRNSRNHQRKQDVATILGFVGQYKLNHSGNYPPACGYNPGHPCVGGGGPDTLTSIQTKFSFYDPANSSSVKIQLGDETGASNPGAVTDPNLVAIYNYYKCQNPGGTVVRNGAGYNDTVALYAVETSGGVTSQCMEL